MDGRSADGLQGELGGTGGSGSDGETEDHDSYGRVV